MNIHENTALLDAFADGELTAEEMAEVQAHLDSCPDCRAYVDDVLAIRAAFPTENDWALPADFTDKVMGAVAKTPQSRPKKQPWGKLLTAAACLAVIVLVQRGVSGGMAETMDTAAYSTADCTVEESVQVERSMDTPAEMEDVEEPAALYDSAAAYTTSAKQETNGAPTETSSGTEAIPMGETEDSWVEGPGGNVIFSCTVYVAASDVGDALDGLEGKPFSTTYEPEKGVIGTGYAMEQAEFEHIWYDVLNRPAEAMAAEPTTALCCIVVTEG